MATRDESLGALDVQKSIPEKLFDLPTLDLSVLSGVINAVEQQFGIDACLDYCERQYSEMFRSEEYALNTILSDEFTLDEAKEELSDGIIMAVFLQSQAEYKHTPSNDDQDRYAEGFYNSFECWQEANDKVVQSIRDQITPNTLVVEIVNYKGEGEGISLFDTSKTLRIYRGKYFYS